MKRLLIELIPRSETISFVSIKKKYRSLLFVLAIGIALCIWDLGSTGLIDETPPLFAAAGRAMSSTGDWITPRVNGLARYDKPPLIYWLMALGYSFPFQSSWDVFGTWSARLPSALSTILLMLVLADTVMNWPQNKDLSPRKTSVLSAIAFGLSPLVMIWSRIAVSDALLCSTLGISLLFQWRSYAKPKYHLWWIAWIFLGLAVLTKGPVAIALTIITISLFGCFQNDFAGILDRIKPIKGFWITLIISLPWYLAELIAEGQPFWDSFFGYHNFQRFTSVVNSHQEPWWFFFVIFIVASLPFTPLLVFGLFKSLSTVSFNSNQAKEFKPENSLNLFSSCWLLAVFVLFTCSATKLPSYWLPATPAAGILIGMSWTLSTENRKGFLFSWISSAFLSLLLAIIFLISPFWIQLIKDPEMPKLGIEVLSSGLLTRASICLGIAFLLGGMFLFRPRSGMLFWMQLPLIAFQVFVLQPAWTLADKLRQEPLRDIAQLIKKIRRPNENILMVGSVKPSLHFYTEEVIIYEGRSPRALINLSDRLRSEVRYGWQGFPINHSNSTNTALVVIDRYTSKKKHWQDLDPFVLGRFGIYYLWRLDRFKLEKREKELISSGLNYNWKEYRPERF